MAQTDEGHIRDALKALYVAVTALASEIDRYPEDYRESMKDAADHIDAIRVRGDAARKRKELI